ncbi:glutamate receptor ionotropic, delta-1-like [Paramacrobiotus metropolitanus]|uniref:glutamate receptor ionotropic, delta-1-like n=1 Tax=Paramacrobiotus metropolitanus TaxID=2943436 RepID=UPI0024461E9A|nr:glutamate receptor ionotropic, delta-1-like [Paramacrobiotus metropolitanus]
MLWVFLLINVWLCSGAYGQVRVYMIHLNGSAAADKVTGFLNDYVAAVMAQANLTYTVTQQPDSRYGALQADGTWNGLVGSLVNKSADIVAADLTITSIRDTVIDFTDPYTPVHLRVVININASSADGLKYLVTKDSSDQIFIQSSKEPKIQAIWANIQANNGFVDNYQVGLDKVLSGGYALIMESVAGGAFNAANPGVAKITDDVLWETYYAFGVQQGSPLRLQLSRVIEKLNAIGTTQTLFAKWGLTDRL